MASPSSAGGEAGVSSLDDLTIDVSKDWQGYGISNLGYASSQHISGGTIIGSLHRCIRTSDGRFYSTTVANIQQAINDFSDDNGGIIYIPSGIYEVSDTIVIKEHNITLQGAGAGDSYTGSVDNNNYGTVLKMNGDLPNGIIKISGSDTTPHYRYPWNCAIRDIGFSGDDRTHSGCALYISRTHDTKLERLFINDISGLAIKFENAYAPVLRDSNIQDCGISGSKPAILYMGAGNGTGDICTTPFIENCVFEPGYYGWIHVDYSKSNISRRGIVRGCYFEGDYNSVTDYTPISGIHYGIRTGPYWLIEGNNFHGNCLHSYIEVSGSKGTYNRIIGNTFAGGAVDTTTNNINSQIVVYGNAIEVIIHNNNFIDSNYNGIDIESSYGSFPSIVGNSFYNMDNHGIRSLARKTLISDNLLKNTGQDSSSGYAIYLSGLADNSIVNNNIIASSNIGIFLTNSISNTVCIGNNITEINDGGYAIKDLGTSNIIRNNIGYPDNIWSFISSQAISGGTITTAYSAVNGNDVINKTYFDANNTSGSGQNYGYDYLVYKNDSIYTVQNGKDGSTYYTNSGPSGAGEALQYAVTQLGTTGGLIQIASGTYMMSTQIDMNSNIWLRGSGWSTILKNYNLDDTDGCICVENIDNLHFSDFMISGHHGLYIDVNGSNHSNFLIENIKVVGANDGTGSYTQGFTIDARDGTISNITYRDCYASKMGSHGFVIYGNRTTGHVENVTYDNCKSIRNGLYGSSQSNWATGFDVPDNTNVKNLTFINCLASGCLESGFHVDPYVAQEHIKFIGCKSLYNGRKLYLKATKTYWDWDFDWEAAGLDESIDPHFCAGFYIVLSGNNNCEVTIDNCVAVGNPLNGISTAGHLIIRDNYIEMPIDQIALVSSSAIYGIRSYNGNFERNLTEGRGTQIKGNVIRNCISGASIHINYGRDHQIIDNDIYIDYDKTIYDGHQGIYILNASGVRIEGNKFKNCPKGILATDLHHTMINNNQYYMSSISADSSHIAIYVNQECTHVDVKDNHIRMARYPIRCEGDTCNIIDNYIYSGGVAGGGVVIVRHNSSVIGNTFYHPIGRPLNVSNYNNLLIANNRVFGGSNYGFSLVSCHNCNIHGNYISGCKYSNIRADTCNNINICNNTLIGSGYDGLRLHTNHGCIVNGNYIYKNIDGIEIQDCDTVILSNNILSGNTTYNYHDLGGNTNIRKENNYGITKTQTKTSGYTAQTNETVLASNSITIKLPNTHTCDDYVTVKNIGTGTITVSSQGISTIDGSAEYTMSIQYESITCLSNGSNWYLI